MIWFPHYKQMQRKKIRSTPCAHVSVPGFHTQGASGDILNANNTLSATAFHTQGASDDILNAKNTLYQHLTWDPDKTVSLCSKLALPLATPAIGVTPPVSPKSTSAEGACRGAWWVLYIFTVEPAPLSPPKQPQNIEVGVLVTRWQALASLAFCRGGQ